ncbi:MAG: hypothetical protein GF398_20980 [Chitinivibrionales bacterium]|nr:hypothetical protein [Chitinivibrionales bacterium]
MNVALKQKAAHTIIAINDDIIMSSDIQELKGIVQQLLNEGKKSIALAFTQDSYLSTPSVRIIAQCFELIKDRQGAFTFIAPNRDIRDMLDILNLRVMVTIVGSEDELK